MTPTGAVMNRSLNASVTSAPPTFADSPLRGRTKRPTLAPLKISGTAAAKLADAHAESGAKHAHESSSAPSGSAAAAAAADTIAVPFTGADGSIAYSDGTSACACELFMYVSMR